MVFLISKFAHLFLCAVIAARCTYFSEATPLQGAAFVSSFCSEVLPVLQENAKDVLKASQLSGLDEPTQSVINATTEIFAIGTSLEVQQTCANIKGTGKGTSASDLPLETKRRLAKDQQSETKGSSIATTAKTGVAGLFEKLEGLFCKVKGSFCSEPDTINGNVQPANLKPSITTLVSVGLASMNKTAPSSHALTLIGDVVCGLAPAIAKCDAN